MREKPLVCFPTLPRKAVVGLTLLFTVEDKEIKEGAETERPLVGGSR